MQLNRLQVTSELVFLKKLLKSCPHQKEIHLLSGCGWLGGSEGFIGGYSRGAWFPLLSHSYNWEISMKQWLVTTFDCIQPTAVQFQDHYPTSCLESHSKTVIRSWYCICTAKIQPPWGLFCERKHRTHHPQLIQSNRKVKKNKLQHVVSPMKRRMSRFSTPMYNISNLIYTDNPVQLALSGASKRQWYSQATGIFTSHHLTLPCN